MKSIEERFKKLEERVRELENKAVVVCIYCGKSLQPWEVHNCPALTPLEPYIPSPPKSGYTCGCGEVVYSHQVHNCEFSAGLSW
ncbi:MAG TPA: hypothetical protein VEP90_04605 [Methylomirabilota bacterium]|nr:hypothetical protein [Methylomirabilota bacterium]